MGNLDKASGGALANFLSFMILVYLNITKKTFDVFKCEPEDPPDDPINPTRLMSMMPSQICFAPGNWDTGLHVKLLPWAMAFAVTYSFAFPVYVVFKTVLNKKVIFEDSCSLRRSVASRRTATHSTASGCATPSCTRTSSQIRAIGSSCPCCESLEFASLPSSL